MSVDSHFIVRKPQLRMPRAEPGVPDLNGFIFYGPVGAGRLDTATAFARDQRQSRKPSAGETRRAALGLDK